MLKQSKNQAKTTIVKKPMEMRIFTDITAYTTNKIKGKMNNDLQSSFKNLDIYLIDQILKGRYDDCKKIIDLGCGTGRNLFYFLKNNFDVYGLDPNASALSQAIQLAKTITKNTHENNFINCAIENNTLEKESFDLVIANAVLHFAKNPIHFKAMLMASWQLVKPGKFFFARLASSIGIEKLIVPLGDGRYLLPDGSERFLVELETLLKLGEELGATLIEPIKTTNVQNLRCMTTWCLQKK